MAKHRPLGQILLERVLLTEQQLAAALERQRETGELLGRVLVEMGVVTPDDVLEALAAQSGMRVVDLTRIQPQDNALAQISGSVARTYGCLPLSFENGTLTVAISDPLNRSALEELRFMLGVDVEGVLAREDDVRRAIDKYYASEAASVGDLLKEIEGGGKTPAGGRSHSLLDSETVDIGDLEAMAHEAPVVKLLNLVLLQAVKDRASDIHFEPFEDSFRIRYRVDGVLYEMVPPPKSLAMAITSRIKVMSNLDIAETRLPQDGRFQLNIGGNEVDLRVSCLPTIFGESVVMRVLDRSVTTFQLEQLGLGDRNLQLVRKVIARPNGIFLTTGPTGCGKTTTLYACLMELNSPEVKIITTEDPVEYNIEGITQVQINEAIGLTFARCLRHILRQDPDIILVGEIRDLETAKMAIEASLTGHLVLSTIHTNSAPGTITRLIDMEVEPFLITSSLEAVLAQRLVRTICARCKEQYTPDPEELALLGLTKAEAADKTFYRGRGCEACNHIGYVGRTGIFEMLIMNDTLRSLIMKRATTSEIREAALASGMTTLRDDGLSKIYRGITTVEEVAREVMGNE